MRRRDFAKPRRADREAEEARKDHPDRRDEERVQQPDEKGAPISRGEGIGDQMLIDVEAGALVPEAEIGRDVMRLHMRERDRRSLEDENAKA